LGPGINDLDSSRIIGENQYLASLRLYQSATTLLKGPIDFRHKYFKISEKDILPRYSQDGKPAKTCRPAVGYSFAAGKFYIKIRYHGYILLINIDGPGGFNFQQGNNR
jgi:neutral ceramidase